MGKNSKPNLTAREIIDIIRAVDQTGLEQVNVEVGEVWLKIKGRRVRNEVELTAREPDSSETSPAPPRERDEDTLEQTTTITGANDSLLVDTTRTEGLNGLFELRAPLSGTVHRRAGSSGKHWVGVGNLIEVGDALCVLESNDSIISLHSEVDATVVDICVEETETVEAGQVLFRAEPA